MRLVFRTLFVYGGHVSLVCACRVLYRERLFVSVVCHDQSSVFLINFHYMLLVPHYTCRIAIFTRQKTLSLNLQKCDFYKTPKIIITLTRTRLLLDRKHYHCTYKNLTFTKHKTLSLHLLKCDFS